MEKQKVLIAENHAILRDGLRLLLEPEKDLEIVAEAGNGREAVHATTRHHPDLILMDISMPLTNGTEAIRIIKRRFPDTKVLVLTVHNTEDYLRRALEAGADGYILKDDPSSELLLAIRHVMKGKKYLSPGISNRVINGYLGSGTPQTQGETLTGRERETLKLIAEGLKNKEIAGYLSVSVKTVEKHRANVMKKLDLHSGPALTAYAFANGYVKAGET